MKKIELGQTGLMVSRVGLGTVKFGRNTGVKYPNPFEIPDDILSRFIIKFYVPNFHNVHL